MNIKEKIQNLKYSAINSLIYYNYYHKKIDENIVYVESRSGKDFSGNVFRIVEELSTGKYGDFKIVVYAKEDVHPIIHDLEMNYSLKIDRIVSSRTQGTMIMEKAKYIITDSVLFHKFVRRPEQVIVNTWSGTPLKTLGIHNDSQAYRCSSAQQAFFSSDYLLFSNDYSKEHILSSYMMEKVYPGKILMGGQPRNCAFYKSANLKDDLDISGKEVFAYMPSFKAVKSFKNSEDRKKTMEKIIHDIDDSLREDQVLLVKFHASNSNLVDFSGLKHVKAFPKDYDAYDILNLADVLVSDYSEVIFDFANTKRKIVLFTFDEERFFEHNRTYLSLSDLPFSKVDNVSDLIDELNSPKEYDESEFLRMFCPYDSANATEDLCRHVFNGEFIIKEKIIEDSNANTLIFGGPLTKNGMTSSMMNLLGQVDSKNHNYFVSYRTWGKYISKYYKDVFSLIPENVELMPLRTPINPTFKEKLYLNRFLKKSHEGNLKLTGCVREMFKRELRRSFGDFKFDNIIQFTGYGSNEILMFCESESNSIIWSHGNMMKVIESGNSNRTVLKYAYNNYDHVAVVSDESAEITYEISQKKDNISVVHNFIDYEQIIENSNKEIEFQNETLMMCSNPNGIVGVMEGTGKKFITVGRFSDEKNHKVLINAFNRFCRKYPDTQLIIIGGYGPLYFSTRRYAEKKEFGHNITIIRSVFNPMPILEKCDLFILPSKYEGWPMSILEANVLDVPIIASDIGATQWLKEYDAYLFKNNFKGILQAMNDFMEGKVNCNVDIDYEEYNRNVLNEFLKLINE